MEYQPKLAPGELAVGASVLAGLSPTERQQLARVLQPRRFQPRELVLDPESPAPRQVTLILRGRVRLFQRGADGREFTLDFAARGALLGLAALFGLSDETLAEAETVTLVGTADAAALRPLLNGSPSLRRAVLEQLGGRLLAAETRLHGLLSANAGGRLWEALARRGRARGRPLAEGGVFLDDPPTHLELAREIGCRRETVTRLLAAAERQGLIRRDGHCLTIPSLEQLGRGASS